VPKHRPFSDKIGDSLSGLMRGWRHDRAIRTHAIFSAIGLIALAIARPPVAWILAFVVLLVVGLAAELINDAVETLLDRLHPDTDPAIGAAKDMASSAPFAINAAAAVVLVCALLFARS
jgi:diacylglycerol kinase (ATP)